MLRKIVKQIAGGKMAAVFVLGLAVVALSAQVSTGAPAVGKGEAALAHAAEAQRYLYILFYEQDDAATAAMRQVLQGALVKAATRAESVEINRTDPAEKATVRKFDAQREPMPLVLTVAPDGFITGGFPLKCTEQELLDALVSPNTRKSLEALAAHQLVFICVQNAKTALNQEAMQGVQDFQADRHYAKTTAVVTIDPANAEDSAFLHELKLDPNSKQAVTLLLAPPGTEVARLVGSTSKEGFVTAYNAAQAEAKSGGCCPSGSGKTCAPAGGK